MTLQAALGAECFLCRSYSACLDVSIATVKEVVRDVDTTGALSLKKQVMHRLICNILGSEEMCRERKQTLPLMTFIQVRL